MKKYQLYLLMVAFCCLFLNSTPKEPPIPITQMVKDWQRAKDYTKEYLDAMPEEGYQFKPTPQMRNFAQQYLHLAAVNYRYTTFASGQPNPYPGDELEKKKEMQSKAAVIKITMESYDTVIDALKSLTAAQAKEIAKWYEHDVSKEVIFSKGFEHQTHHRAQTTVYLRLKGITPPGEKLL